MNERLVGVRCSGRCFSEFTADVIDYEYKYGPDNISVVAEHEGEPFFSEFRGEIFVRESIVDKNDLI